jgi:hypothetical protein
LVDGGTSVLVPTLSRYTLLDDGFDQMSPEHMWYESLLCFGYEVISTPICKETLLVYLILSNPLIRKVYGDDKSREAGRI